MSKLCDRVREEIRTLHYSIRTEATYVAWIKQFILFHGTRHPLEMGEATVGQGKSSAASVPRNVVRAGNRLTIPGHEDVALATRRS